MNLLRKIFKIVSDPDARFLALANRGFYDSMPDEEYLKRKYKSIFKTELNLENPVSYNEKLQWLKLYDRNPLYTKLVDKYLVRDYIAEKIGEKYLIPLLGVWDDPDEIDFDALPNQFVLKCNHNSGLGMCICKDKSTLDIADVKSKLRKGLKQDYYLTGREWPYKDVPRKIICEQYMSNTKDSSELSDYKFICFNGKAESAMVCTERNTGHPNFYFYDKDWNLLPYFYHQKDIDNGFTLPRPEMYTQMWEIAEKLSEGFAEIRIDLYSSCGNIYFGEMTFFMDSGFDSDTEQELLDYWGSLIILPSK